MSKIFNFLILSVSILRPQVFCVLNLQLTQPQIYVEDGNLYLVPAAGRNLVLVSNGTGKIIFNNVELNYIVNLVQNSTRDLTSIKRIFGNPLNSTSGITNRLTLIEQAVSRLDQVGNLDARLVRLEEIVTYNLSSSASGRNLPSLNRINQRLRRLITRVEALESRNQNGDSSVVNPCNSNPCLNGATCVPTSFGPICLCTQGWEGEFCGDDVNECNWYRGTDLGCQNGATCVNKPGYYECQCRSNWMGIHCTKRSGDCSSGAPWELCGHGTCINQHTGPRPFTCLCDQGWKTDGVNPGCTIDIDECNGPHQGCSNNPPVFCINTPGGFHCGPCPAGYTGNGFQCNDINECLYNNGGCSTSPMVACINTQGSRACGQCPSGYIGNGVTCQYMGICQINNGGCHPMARCVENPVIGQNFVQCLCPGGYTGTGMGLSGCYQYGGGGGGGEGSGGQIGPISSNPCSSNPCVNGACSSYRNSFMCTCVSGFTGPNCAVRINPCDSNPCLNGGSCIPSFSEYTCHCTSDFTGHQCQTQQQSCGGIINEVEGNLKFPQVEGLTYSHNTSCIWLLKTRPGKVLNITFTRFHLEGNPENCRFDWLVIHDGFDTSSPSIGKFCGDAMPKGGNIVSTHEMLFLWFYSDHSITGLGFEFNWNSTDPLCGGNSTGLTHGAINSPGYPGRYPLNRDCVWTISVNLNKRIQLVFANLQIESHANCSFDYVEIKDGLSDNSPVLVKYCNSTLPPPLISSGPHLTVRFHSDDSLSDTGFHITYAEVPGIPGCGGVFTNALGVFSSPQHPEPYAHGLDCEWLIRLTSNEEQIYIQFTTFLLETGNNCAYDYLEIREGNSIQSPLIGRFCGRNTPPPYRSLGHELFIHFHSDESVAFGGFQAKYEAACGGLITTTNGIIKSPYYPSNYPKSRQCIFVISQPVGKAIRLDFNDFDVESGIDVLCQFDYLEIRDGDNENSTLIGHFCGPQSSMPDPIISSFNYLWLKFKTDGSVQNKGFHTNFTTFDMGCGGIFKGVKHGFITSPGHPEIYPEGVKCQWTIVGNPGEVIRLSWVSFSLEQHIACSYDKVEVYDNSTLFKNGGMLGRFCGNQIPPTITSTDNIMTIFFISDHSLSQDGFMANYIIINDSSICGGLIFSESGGLKSPGYPNGYPHRKTCSWVISVPIGQQIMLNITEFEVENGSVSGCIYDYLEIRNGGHPTSPLIGKYCGTNKPPRFIPSFGHMLFLKFVSDINRSDKGFLIYWDGTATGCGGTISGPSGSIISPNYPVESGRRSECIWNIKVNPGSIINLVFLDLDVSHSGTSCFSEYVSVQDGNSANSRSIGRFCSSESTISVNSTSNSLRIKAITGGGGGRGFHAKFYSICSQELRGLRGVIESPNFPQPYPHNRNCTWKIIAPLGNTINISFSHFSIEEPIQESCIYDFVEVNQTSSETNEKSSLGKYCGQNVPSIISSTNDTLLINFASDQSMALNGFRLEWVIVGCSQILGGNYGYLSSPGYPIRYKKNTKCQWQIKTDIGTKVELTIYDLDVEHEANCRFDYLRVYGGLDENAGVLTHLCSTILSPIPTLVTSHGNHMLVEFFADHVVGGKGFYAFYRGIDGGCGGIMTTPTGFIQSPNYPSNYDHSEGCEWTITVNPSYVVNLTFLDFDVEFHYNCTFDNVTVYDGPNRYFPVLLSVCGNSLPPIIKSTTNTILIALTTDATFAGKGFRASYKQACGATLSGNYGGEIATQGFPQLGYNGNCTWKIIGDAPNDNVKLTITNLMIRQNRELLDCHLNYIEILDGVDNEAPLIGRFCFDKTPPTIYSTGNGLIVNYITSSTRSANFRAVYGLSTSACGGVLTSAQGSFTTPKYPNNYPMNTECIWTLEASPGNRVQLNFREFNIETNDFCNTDFVEIHEGDLSGPLLGHFCGTNIPNNITALQTITILFRSNGEGQAPGFYADYALLHGSELSGSYGSIASPLYPYPNSLRGQFTWRVTVNESMGIEFTFPEFELDAGQSSSCINYIKIFDGYDENSNSIFQYCAGQSSPEPVTTNGNIAYVQLVKAISYAGDLFIISWREVPLSSISRPLVSNITGCGGNFTIPDGNLTYLLSPNYPLRYPSNLRCEWTFTTLEHSKIVIFVNEMQLENHPVCEYDKLQVYDGVNGLPNYNLNYTLCSRYDQNKTLVSTGKTVKFVFSSDDSIAGQGFNLTVKSVCGGYLRSSRGRLTSPGYPNNYGRSQCKWIIMVKPGRTISLRFDALDIYQDPEVGCSTDKLILRDGNNANSPFLGTGRYCGSNLPPTIESTSNQIYISFTAWTAARRGFSLIYNEVASSCGGQISLTDDAPDFTFNSPNNPNTPPPFSECVWVFTAPSNEAIQIDFIQRFDLNHDDYRCGREFVEIRDGGTGLSPRLGTFCREMPGTTKSTGNTLYFRYYSDIPEPQTGFKATASIATCGGTIVRRYGVLTSPGYPISYEPNLNCSWLIQGPRGTSFDWDMSEYELPPGTMSLNGTIQCPNNTDRVIVTEENVTDTNIGIYLNPQTNTFCGVSQSSFTGSTSMNKFRVKLITNAVRETKKGFKLQYRTSYGSCGGKLITPTGTITSPLYPQSYPHHKFCRWEIIAPPGRRIRIEFQDFDLEEKIITEGKPEGFCVDSLTVKQGFNYDTLPLYNDSLCGQNLPPPVESTTNRLFVQFSSDYSVSHRGFKLTYTTDLPLSCGGTIVGDSGFIAPPNGNLTNTPNTTRAVTCNWIRDGDSGNGTSVITFNEIKIPPWISQTSPFCYNTGSLTILPTNAQTSYWKKYCNIEDQTHNKLFIRGSGFDVRFLSIFREASFNISYKVFPCGGTFSNGNVDITSPNYPNSHPVDIDCIWVVDPTPYSNGQLRVTFNDFQLAGNAPDCSREKVTIRNGRFPTSPIIGTWCGSDIPQSFLTMSTRLWIEFYAGPNADTNKKGFNISTELVPKGCGGIIHDKKGKILSPKASTGTRYQNNIECEWIIESVPGYMVHLSFVERFDIETSANCSNDYIEISEKKSFIWKLKGRYCGKAIPPLINTTSTSVKVKFHSNEAVDGDGFKLLWFSVCGGFFDEPSGMIRSAHFDRINHTTSIENSHSDYSFFGYELYWGIQKCNYVINGNSSEDYIVAEFLPPFNIFASTGESCLTNVTLYDGDVNSSSVERRPRIWISRRSRISGPYCGRTLPPPFIGRGMVTISYFYRAYYESFGFRIQYNIFQCGGEITEPRSISSPGHPVSSAPNMNCTWVIKAPPGKVVRIKFESLEIEYSQRCQYDYVKLFDGPLIQENKKLGAFCGNLTTDFRRISSKDGSMVVQFRTDTSVQHGGFKAAIDFTLGESQGCGGIINLTQIGTPNTLRAPDSNNDGKYDGYLDCQWLIVAPSFAHIEFSMTNFNLEGSRSGSGINDDPCPYDYLQAYDGTGPNGPLLGKFCGANLPPMVSSTSNFMWLNFISDGFNHLTGFTANIYARESPCGSFVLNATSSPQILTSPQFPENYPQNMRCRWTVEGARRFDEVDIRFIDLNIETSRDCSKDKLQIKDVANSYTSQENIGGPILFNGGVNSRAVDWRFRISGIDSAPFMKDLLYCGTQMPPDFFSIGRRVEIVFETDNSNSGRGFKIEYKSAGCNRTLETEQGRIFSPEWPGHSPVFSNCIFLIKAPSASFLSIYFNQFLLESSDGCSESSFEARENNSTGNVLARYCGSTRPNPIFSSANVIWINYWTRVRMNRGFDFSFTSTPDGKGCGGNLFHTGGSLTSPNYPGQVATDLDCKWRLRVPGGLKIQITFEVFFLGSDCSTDFVEIYSLNSHEPTVEPLLFSRYCSGDTPSSYQGMSDMAIVRYKASRNNSGNGWLADFKGVLPSNII